MTRYQPGDRLSPQRLQSVSGGAVDIPDPARLVHLQFRRFAGCPVCDLHLRSVVRRHDELVARGVREVVVFHSSAEELRAFGAHELPFPVIADPGKRLYAAFGVRSARAALTDPRVWLAILRGIGATLWLTLRGKTPLRVPSAAGGRLGLPADFLIASDGRIIACKYGEHAFDQWSPDELIQRVEGPSTNDPTSIDAVRSRCPGYGD